MREKLNVISKANCKEHGRRKFYWMGARGRYVCEECFHREPKDWNAIKDSLKKVATALIKNQQPNEEKL